jgi:ubiquinone/menaquinone biosynthesis C-methylase UbiE
MKSKGKPVSDEASTLLKRAYALSGAEDAQQLYRDWASTYDQHLEQDLRYIAPVLIAEMLAEAVKDRTARILDVGCGTGLVGEHLAGQGFSGIDGLDFSPEMLARAERKACYRHLVEGDLNAALDIPSQTYDGAISCGTFTHGHVQANALDEIVRVLNPSSYLACTVHRDIWHSAGFDSRIASLIKDEVIVLSRQQKAPYYEGSEADGNYCLIRKL